MEVIFPLLPFAVEHVSPLRLTVTLLDTLLWLAEGLIASHQLLAEELLDSRLRLTVELLDSLLWLAVELIVSLLPLAV